MNKKNSLFLNIVRTARVIHMFDRKFIFAEVFFTLASTILPFAIAWYSAEFINKIAVGTFSGIFDPGLVTIVVLYVSLPLVLSVLEVFKQRSWNTFYVNFSSGQDAFLMEKKAHIDIQTYESPAFNNLMVKVIENSHKLCAFADWMFFSLSRLVKVVVAVVIVASYNWLIALIVCISFIPDMYAEMKYGERKWGIWDAKAETKRKYYEAKRHFDNVQSLIEMKVFGTKSYFKRTVDGLIGSFNQEVVKNENKKAHIKTLTVLCASLVSAGVILYLMGNVVEGGLQIGTFIFILGAMLGLQDSVADLFSGVSNLRSDNLFVQDIFSFLHTKNLLKNGKVKLERQPLDIEFRNVSFAYPDSLDRPIFRNLNFSIKEGEKIAIVGVNGAGKTTLTKLLMRFYDPTEGEVLVNGQNIKDLDVLSYYRHVGYLSQEYDKYRVPVSEAIAIGDVRKEAVIARVIEASKRAGSHDFIQAWPAGYDSHLGKEFDNGIEPSVGQWQKLALARLFYRDPVIWVLDEPTASIDAVAEMEVFQELEALPDDKTVILISHRFNTVKNADRIMVIEDGEIKEFASHDELMAMNQGVYKNLFTLQKDSFNSRSPDSI